MCSASFEPEPPRSYFFGNPAGRIIQLSRERLRPLWIACPAQHTEKGEKLFAHLGRGVAHFGF